MATRKSKRKVQHYGWVPDLPDHRDILYAAPAAAMQKLPTQVDLRPQCPKEVYDQGQLGSCTANAIAAAIEFDRIKLKLRPAFTPSRLFIYYNERVMESSIDSDSGAQIRDGIKSVATQGAPPEPQWPYDITKFRDKPPTADYSTAAKYIVVLYQRLVQNLNQMKGCLASGYPFVFGITVYESFEGQDVAKTDWVVPRCRPPRSRSSVGTPCWRSATTTPRAGSSRATPGDPAGE